jgi:hypothetical protein
MKSPLQHTLPKGMNWNTTANHIACLLLIQEEQMLDHELEYIRFNASDMVDDAYANHIWEFIK